MAKRERLAELRKGRGWLQKDVVKFLRERYGIAITDRYYGMFEQGARRPPLHIALALSDLFQQPVEVLFPDQRPNGMFGEILRYNEKGRQKLIEAIREEIARENK